MDTLKQKYDSIIDAYIKHFESSYNYKLHRLITGVGKLALFIPELTISIDDIRLLIDNSVSIATFNEFVLKCESLGSYNLELFLFDKLIIS